jgi:pyridoxal phosphate enzyme (YggS family)
MDLDRLRKNLEGVRERINLACRRAGRPSESVTLVVVTKSAPPGCIPPLAALGVADIGENRAVEGLARVGGLSGIRRHLIGHLQTNKVRKALEWADVIHSVDRPSLLAELGRHNKKPPVFVQVNISGEATKGGYGPREAEEAVVEARRTHEVLGLMTMAPREGDARDCFRSLRELARRCGVRGLSMGMTGDFEAAVEEGATCVRIGSAIFEGVLL